MSDSGLWCCSVCVPVFVGIVGHGSVDWVTWWSGSGGIQAWSRRPTGFLQCFDTVGLVIWPVEIVPEMTYNVLSGTLSLYTTTALSVVARDWLLAAWDVSVVDDLKTACRSCVSFIPNVHILAGWCWKYRLLCFNGTLLLLCCYIWTVT